MNDEQMAAPTPKRPLPIAVERDAAAGAERLRYWSVALARVVLGAGYIAGGLIPFIHWGALPIPGPEGGPFISELVRSDILRVSKTLEIIFGAALVLNVFVPLSVAVLGPVLFFIAWIDWYLEPFTGGVIAVAIMTTCQLYLAYMYRDSYRAMFVMKAKY
jgi:hypothetical protein